MGDTNQKLFGDSKNKTMCDHLIKIDKYLYKFVKVLGKGTYGCVSQYKKIRSTSKIPKYRVIALHYPPSFPVFKPSEYIAIKNIDVKQLTNPEDFDLSSIYNEISVLSRFRRSPHIIDCHGYIIENENAYIALEYAEWDLLDYFRYKGLKSIDSDDLLSIVKDMIAAIHVLHNSGITHGDIKINNFVMVNKKVKLIDFGLSKNASMIKGIFALHAKLYRAPELLIQQKTKINYLLTDIWALGISILLFFTRYVKLRIKGKRTERDIVTYIIRDLDPEGHLKSLKVYGEAKYDKSYNVFKELKKACHDTGHNSIIVDLAESMLQVNPKLRTNHTRLIYTDIFIEKERMSIMKNSTSYYDKHVIPLRYDSSMKPLDKEFKKYCMRNIIYFSQKLELNMHTVFLAMHILHYYILLRDKSKGLEFSILNKHNIVIYVATIVKMAEELSCRNHLTSLTTFLEIVYYLKLSKGEYMKKSMDVFNTIRGVIHYPSTASEILSDYIGDKDMYYTPKTIPLDTQMSMVKVFAGLCMRSDSAYVELRHIPKLINRIHQITISKGLPKDAITLYLDFVKTLTIEI